MSVLTKTLEALDDCRADLSRIAEELKWTLEPGLQGRAEPVRVLDLELPAPTANRPVLTLEEQLERNPDYVPGGKWQLDSGDHRMRDAFVDATRLLAIAEVRIAGAVTLMGTGRKQPPLVKPERFMSFGVIEVVRISMSHRIDLLTYDLPMIIDERLRWSAHQIDGRAPKGKSPTARHALELAAKKLSKAVTVGRDTEGHGEEACKVCSIRPKAEKKGGRCHTCFAWFDRNHYERPPSIDQDQVAGPLAARQRRMARGENWGRG